MGNTHNLNPVTVLKFKLTVSDVISGTGICFKVSSNTFLGILVLRSQEICGIEEPILGKLMEWYKYVVLIMSVSTLGIGVILG